MFASSSFCLSITSTVAATRTARRLALVAGGCTSCFETRVGLS